MPVEDEAQRIGRPPLYPWKTLAVGESFNFREGVCRDNAQTQGRMACKRLAPKRFVVRQYGNEGYCCWRVK